MQSIWHWCFGDYSVDINYLVRVRESLRDASKWDLYEFKGRERCLLGHQLLCQFAFWDANISHHLKNSNIPEFDLTFLSSSSNIYQ